MIISQNQFLKMFMNPSFQTRFVMGSFERLESFIHEPLSKPWRVLFRLELTAAIVQRDHACVTNLETVATCDQTFPSKHRRFGLKRCDTHVGTPSQKGTITCV